MQKEMVSREIARPLQASLFFSFPVVHHTAGGLLLNTIFFVEDVRSQLLLFLNLLCDCFVKFKLLCMSGEEVASSRFPRVDLKDPKEVNIRIIR